MLRKIPNIFNLKMDSICSQCVCARGSFVYTSIGMCVFVCIAICYHLIFRNGLSMGGRIYSGTSIICHYDRTTTDRLYSKTLAKNT